MKPFVSLDVSGQSLDHTLSHQNEFDSSEPKKPAKKSEKESCKIKRFQSSLCSPPKTKVPKKSKKVIRKQKKSNHKPISATRETSKMFKCSHCNAVYAKAV